MADAILVPQVGQDLTEAKIVALNVKLGDPVKKGDIVAEVESEKATFEVEAFSSGIVVDLPYKVGDLATVLEPLMLVGQPHEGGAAIVPAPAAPTAPSPVEMLSTRIAPVQEPAVLSAAASGVVRASPVARRVAAASGIDLAAVAGSGPRGAIVLRDVEERIARADASVPPVAPPLSGGVAIRVLQDGQGHPVVFLHGFGSDLSSWRAFVPRVPLGNPMIGVDLPAHGGSAGVAIDRFEAIVDAVARALAAAGHHRLHLVGHSVGAAVAAALADRGDVEVRSLTLLAPAGLGPRVDGDFVAGFLAARSEAALGTWLQRLVHRPESLPGGLARATLDGRATGDVVEAQGKLASVLFEGSTQLFSVRDAVGRFGGPLRVVLGRQDRIIPVTDSEAALPGHAAVHRLENVGHLPQLEAAALVGRIVTETIRAAG